MDRLCEQELRSARFAAARAQLKMRLEVLAGLLEPPGAPLPGKLLRFNT